MKKRKYTDRIIFHHSLTTFGDVDLFRRYHINHNGYEDIGYHYVIPEDGVIETGRNLSMVGAHCFGRNSKSIGVCLIGDFRYTEPSMRQLHSSQKLVHDLCRHYQRGLLVQFHRPRIMWNACPGKKLDRVDFLEVMDREIYSMGF